MSKQKFKQVTVTVEITYLIPMYDEQHTQINGWTVDEVVRDWFERYDLNQHHASRDAHRVGGGMKLINTRIDDLS